MVHTVLNSYYLVIKVYCSLVAALFSVVAYEESSESSTFPFFLQWHLIQRSSLAFFVWGVVTISAASVPGFHAYTHPIGKCTVLASLFPMYFNLLGTTSSTHTRTPQKPPRYCDSRGRTRTLRRYCNIQLRANHNLTPDAAYLNPQGCVARSNADDTSLARSHKPGLER